MYILNSNHTLPVKNIKFDNIKGFEIYTRYINENKPPVRTLSPGRVYRNEAISARAHCIFHQVEGLYINENVSFADLKQCLLYFAKGLI